MRVDILQEYVPAYREPLFLRMKELAALRGFQIRILAGVPQGAQAKRADASTGVIDVLLNQRELRVAGRRITWRRTRSLVEGSDLLVVEQARRNLDVYPALYRSRPRVAMWGHGSDHIGNASSFRQRLLVHLTNRATWFFGYTQASVDSVVCGGFTEARTTVLWNTTDAERLRENIQSLTQPEIQEFRDKMGNGGPLALFIGALDSSKRLPFLVDAADRVAAALPGFGLAVLGGGPEEHWLSGALETRPWLTHAGPVFGRNFALALAASDVIAMPGRVGLVAVDSIVGRTPIITTKFPHHAPEYTYLSSGNSVSAENNVQSYADALLEVLTDARTHQALCEGCEADADNFSIDKMATRFVDGIQAALTTAS
ncbi:glycosyltransferase (plasmid) [Coraliomargarita sp. W4R53]